MKHILKVASLQNLPDTKPLIAMDQNGDMVCYAAVQASDFIDLGLSVKWRNRNIGAETIYDYGNYYAWGELAQHAGWPSDKSTHPYDWNEYKYANGAQNKLTKYCPTDKTDYWDGEPAGTPDNKLSLEIMDDIAYQTDNSWRMPTKAECEALIALPNKWMTINNVNGRVFCRANDPGVSAGDFSIMEESGLWLYDSNYDANFNLSDDMSPEGLQYVSSKAELNALLTEYYANDYDYEGTVDVDTMLFKDEEHETPAVAGTDYHFGSFPEFNQNTMLFLPAAGCCYGSDLYNAGIGGAYWSSSLNTADPDNAWDLYVKAGNIYMSYYTGRCNGFSVRPVSQ